jgi:hypothetical protein
MIFSPFISGVTYLSKTIHKTLIKNALHTYKFSRSVQGHLKVTAKYSELAAPGTYFHAKKSSSSNLHIVRYSSISKCPTFLALWLVYMYCIVPNRGAGCEIMDRACIRTGYSI